MVPSNQPTFLYRPATTTRRYSLIAQPEPPRLGPGTVEVEYAGGRGRKNIMDSSPLRWVGCADGQGGIGWRRVALLNYWCAWERGQPKKETDWGWGPILSATLVWNEQRELWPYVRLLWLARSMIPPPPHPSKFLKVVVIIATSIYLSPRLDP